MGTSFEGVGAFPGSPKWEKCISRMTKLYKRPDEIRSEFSRDYNRLLHCPAYRRLKHKTQVFFATENDHVCTRIEHVSHVSSVSYTISKELGLNTELCSAIALGHDVGHAPFGHEGETILKTLGKDYITDVFWHERNSLWFVDNIETLPDPNGNEDNLNLTYAVRDGIVCHSGEVDENAILPRDFFNDLSEIDRPNKFSPYTWEGCIVKIADKISYLGRDIEDAISLRILDRSQLRELAAIIKTLTKIDVREVNNTILMHHFILDLCHCSSPKQGICFSKEYLEFINLIKAFNYKNIYYHKRLTYYKKYANVVLESIFEFLLSHYRNKDLYKKLFAIAPSYPTIVPTFCEWLLKYSDCDLDLRSRRKYKNKIIYAASDEIQYVRSILDFISGMSDHFAVKCFNDVMKF
ncbi:HD domain-containing protein [Geomonas sp. RF6]|uniref:deoxyguanosinetriphosphate triphosphohydrolase family protein n=1 Tax=Geomonas sp. RF6 TaxID=2897342 RepID=UPI001E39DD49|nr:HD domain-containing protein [Geomonas sp. RF6]UFS72660.1 HD domain-containing protein [Geomonas sp. RF6]